MLLWHEDGCSTPLPTVEEGSLFTFLSMYRPPSVSTIFPKLQGLHCGSIDMASHIHIFLGPRLEYFSLSTKQGAPPSWQNTLNRMFTTISYMSPPIREMSLSGPVIDNTSDMDTEFSEMVSSLPYLRSLTFSAHPISLRSLALLSICISLKKLHIHSIIEFGPEVGARGLPVSPGFPSLIYLSVVINSIDQFPRLMEHIASTELLRLTVSLTSVPREESLRRAFKTLTTNSCPDQLTELEFSVAERLQGQRSPFAPTITTNTLRPLLVFRKLLRVTVFLCCPYDLDDSLLRDMTSAWPSLEILELLSPQPRRPDIFHSKVTAAGLIPLAIHCPRLVNLAIAFDARQSPVLDDERLFQGHLHHLSNLAVGNSPILAPLQVAMFLSCLFGATHITSWDAESVGRITEALWMEVRNMIPHIAQVRQQERDHKFRSGVASNEALIDGK